MKNIFLMQHSGYINGHFLIKNDGEIVKNENEYEILNFIFSNKIQDFYPLIIEYELSDDNTISELVIDKLTLTINDFINKFNLNPFLNVDTIKNIFDCNMPDYLTDNIDILKDLKINLINKKYYLFDINDEYNSNNDEFTNFEDIKTISDEEINKIKSDVLHSINITKINDEDLANKVIEDSITNGLLKKYHDADEVITMGTLMAILNRLPNNHSI